MKRGERTSERDKQRVAIELREKLRQSDIRGMFQKEEIVRTVLRGLKLSIVLDHMEIMRKDLSNGHG